MNHRSFIKKVLTTTIITVGLSIFTTSSVKAAALFWDIELFDDANTLVGGGEFSYDPKTTDTISFSNASNPQGTQVTVNTLLDSFSLNLLGEELISQPGGNPWWQSNSNTAMQSIGVLRSFGRLVQDRWQSGEFSTTVYGADVISLSGSSTATTGEGIWDFNAEDSSLLETNIDLGFINFPESLLGVKISGTWNATLRTTPDNTPDSSVKATPESSSIATLLALAGLGIVTATPKKSP